MLGATLNPTVAARGANIPAKTVRLMPKSLTCETAMDAEAGALLGVLLCIEQGLANMQNQLRQPVMWKMPPRNDGLYQYMDAYI